MTPVCQKLFIAFTPYYCLISFYLFPYCTSCVLTTEFILIDCLLGVCCIDPQIHLSVKLLATVDKEPRLEWTVDLTS